MSTVLSFHISPGGRIETHHSDSSVRHWLLSPHEHKRIQSAENPLYAVQEIEGGRWWNRGCW